MQYLYLIRCNDLYKIGHASDVSRRVYEMQTGNPYHLEIVKSFLFKEEETLSLESYFHACFSSINVQREWFRMNEGHIKIFVDACQSVVNGNPDMSKMDKFNRDEIKKLPPPPPIKTRKIVAKVLSNVPVSEAQ